VTVLDLTTPEGLARAHVDVPPEARAALLMGHGAGGSVSAPDIAAVARVALELGMGVALVEQPYRVAGRRTPPRTPKLDAAFGSVVEQLAAGPLAGLALVSGGRSSGARVACRTATGIGAVGVLCLAFPLHPPRRAPAAGERPTRLPELEAVQVPVLVVQGESDPFGMPPDGPGRTVVRVTGDHGLKRDLPRVAEAARTWLEGLLA